MCWTRYNQPWDENERETTDTRNRSLKTVERVKNFFGVLLKFANFPPNSSVKTDKIRHF